MKSKIQNPKSKIQPPRISLVVAMARNRVIGRNNRLPWHLPADLKYFKQLTMDHAVIMGRKTFDSIGSKPFARRTNIIVTRKKSQEPPDFPESPDALVAHDLDAAIALAADHDRMKHHRDEIFILGGSQIFREALSRADRIYLTLIEAEIEGDVLFPEFDRSKWKWVTEDA